MNLTHPQSIRRPISGFPPHMAEPLARYEGMTDVRISTMNILPGTK